MQGESFLPLVSRIKSKGRKVMYYHYYENGEHAVSPHFGISTGRYKLIRFYTKLNDWELYDLKKDPSEIKNVYGQKGYEKITSQLKRQLVELITKYEDVDAEKILRQADIKKVF
jgi:hypothetical protein